MTDHDSAIEPTEPAGPTEPLALRRFSSRHIGGRRVAGTDSGPTSVALSPGLTDYSIDPQDTVHVEQAYVQTWIPVNQIQKTPVLLVAGGGLTGSCWETTPDGREGWLLDLLRAGIPVDVLDNVERGRAGWAAVPGLWAGDPVQRGERDMWSSFRIGRSEDYETRQPFGGSQFPVEALDAMLSQSVPRWPSNDAVALDTLVTVLTELGPRVVIGHSHGGGLAARAAARPGIGVPAILLIEPHGLPERDQVRQGHAPVAVLEGDYLDESALWRVLIPRIDDYLASLLDIGTSIERITLPALGITGNSHNPMMDRNSRQISQLVIDWLARLRQDGEVT